MHPVIPNFARSDTFTPFSSCNYGAVARAAGYSLGQTLVAAGLCNRSSGRDRSGLYGNDPKDVPLITQGWEKQPEFMNGDAAK